MFKTEKIVKTKKVEIVEAKEEESKYCCTKILNDLD
jgi:hypothetical protein